MKIRFDRAIFTSWYCSLGDCAYCYMSTQKKLISDPKKARRSDASILAEAYLCKKLGWKIGMISAGYGSYTPESLLDLCKKVNEISNQKVWLNVGVLNENTIESVKGYLEGVFGAVETVNDEARKKALPSKPIQPIESMFEILDNYNLKKAMTIIIGLGETIGDFNLLKKFIIKSKINKIVFYALNPIKGTIFEKGKGPKEEYFIEWIEKTRKEFPKLDIVAGHWVNRVQYIHKMLDAGANSITKYPAIKLFNSEFSKTIEKEIKKAGLEFEGTLTKLPEIDYKEIGELSFDEELKEEIKRKVRGYLKGMAGKQYDGRFNIIN